MADYAATQKLCATCVYYIARRDVNIFNSWVTNCENQGRCAIPNGPFRNAQRTANTCACSYYEKWPVLK